MILKYQKHRRLILLKIIFLNFTYRINKNIVKSVNSLYQNLEFNKCKK